MKRNLRGIGFYVILTIIIIYFAATFTSGKNEETKLKYSVLMQKIGSGEVTDIVVEQGSDTSIAKGKLKDGKEFYANIPTEEFYTSTADYVKNGTLNINIDTSSKRTAALWANLSPFIILIIFVAVIYFFTQQSQGGGGKVMSFGKSRAKLSVDMKNKITFADVAGADEEKEEMGEIVDFLKSPKRYVDLGARIPKGVLLVGPPGTGKTYLAKAVAGEAGVPFFSISGSDFVEMFVGVGASRVRDLFEQAKKNAPCIIFIDEIDAVGRQRGAGLGGGHDEREQTLNQLLVEMDGFNVNEGIIIVAATNRPDILDPALLRPGRFDRQITVGIPDVKAREQILNIHSRKKNLATDVNLSVVAKTTAGFTPADLENLMNEAALLTARRKKSVITMDTLNESMIRVIAGPEKKSRVVSEKDKRLTAYHEAGHAVVQKCLPNADPVHQVSIIPRGRAGGYTLSLPSQDKYYTSKSELEDQLVMLLGGRVAEKLILDDISTGAKNDIDRATAISRAMVTEYGMSDEIGTITFGEHEEVFMGRDFGRTRNYSEEVAAEIDSEIKRIIDRAYQRTETLLKEHLQELHNVAKALIEREKIEAEEFESVFKTGKFPNASREVNEPKEVIDLNKTDDQSRSEQTIETPLKKDFDQKSDLLNDQMTNILEDKKID